ncbi:cysteine-rich venom protein pseudechetoxin-like [Ornithorhynchus anatinus]|uniref:cysteine-rich venom protein pseudechetoxin-like n=1 Tax=Ornithorhynchus anatinus TaxID=9258 RepID=UPI0019D4D2CE|nr:cysteine-rich venom protein pseudechetoxin-like [Ornithorhynchus anatinus]
MILLAVVYWIVVTDQAVGTADPSFTALQTNNPTVQKEIVDEFNEIRRHVNPTASNMLKMAWNEEAAKNAKNWVEKCTLTTSPPEERRIKNTTCNENFFMSTSPNPWSEVIQQWQNSMAEFNNSTTASGRGASVNLYSQVRLGLG